MSYKIDVQFIYVLLKLKVLVIILMKRLVVVPLVITANATPMNELGASKK